MTTDNINNVECLAVCCQTDSPENRDDKSSVITIICRICYDSEKDEPIVSPCCCKGTVAFVHRSCLETWLAESNTTTCELCHHIYRTQRTPKYGVKQAIWRWIRRETPNFSFNVRGIRSDLVACALLTPLAIAITYICLFSADYYNQQRFAHIPAAKWTSISLLIMVVIMLIGFYLWAHMAIKYHSRVWYYWWQRECVVRIPSEELRPSIDQQENNESSQVQNGIENPNRQINNVLINNLENNFPEHSTSNEPESDINTNVQNNRENLNVPNNNLQLFSKVEACKPTNNDKSTGNIKITFTNRDKHVSFRKENV